MEGIEHFLYGVAIDEGYKGNRENSLTLDVLYPEVSNLRKSLLRNYNVLSITLMFNLPESLFKDGHP